jgi:apolipoprotein D and lipocalin family protein
LRLPAPLLLPLLLATGCTEPDPAPVQPVAAVDIGRYSGTWYEIARYANRFEDGRGLDCVDVTASYAPQLDGTLRVVNRCRNAADENQPKEARGTAHVVPNSNNARLRVSFFWPFYGDYWVIGLDPGYRWAVVGEPGRDFLWVLSRSPTMTASDWEAAQAAARAQGFDPARLKRVPQSGAPG